MKRSEHAEGANQTLGLVKAALAEPTPEDAARKLELVKRLESDVDFRHAIEKRNQVAEEAQKDAAGLGVVVPAEAAVASQDTVRDVEGVPVEKSTRDALERSRTQPGLQPPPKRPFAAVEDGKADTREEETAPPVLSPESRSTSRAMIALALLALGGVAVVIWLVVRGLAAGEQRAGVPSAVAVEPSARSPIETASSTSTPINPVMTLTAVPVTTAEPITTVEPSSVPSAPRPTTTTTSATSQAANPSAVPHQTASAPFKWNWP